MNMRCHHGRPIDVFYHLFLFNFLSHFVWSLADSVRKRDYRDGRKYLTVVVRERFICDEATVQPPVGYLTPPSVEICQWRRIAAVI